MQKIDWINGQAGGTPLSAENLNLMQQYIEDAINNIYPIGSYYETSNMSFNPNNVWAGTWVLENDGTVLASKSNTTGSIFNADLGTKVGEEKHELITSEIPAHRHTVSVTEESGSEGYAMVGNWNSSNSFNTGWAGGGQAHNIVQPSKIVNRWHRTA